MQAIKATVKNPWSDSLSLIPTRVRVVTSARVWKTNLWCTSQVTGDQGQDTRVSNKRPSD